MSALQAMEEFKRHLSEFSVAAHHGQPVKCVTLFDVLCSMYQQALEASDHERKEAFQEAAEFIHEVAGDGHGAIWAEQIREMA